MCDRIFFYFYMTILICIPSCSALCGDMLWPPYIEESDFLPGYSELMLDHPVLFEGGEWVIEENGERLILATGTASMESIEDENIAWIEADTKAMERLNSILNRIERRQAPIRSATERSESKTTETAMGVIVEDRFRSFSTTEQSGIIRGSWEAGHWKLNNGNSVGVLRVIASPGYPVVSVSAQISSVSDTLDPAWRSDVLSRPLLRNGGVSIVSRKNENWFLFSGCDQFPKGASAVPVDSMWVAEETAFEEWLQFWDGIKLNSQTKSYLELLHIHQGEAPVFERIIEELSAYTEAQATGVVQRALPVGMFLIDAGKEWRLVAVFRLSIGGRTPELHSHPMARPPIPSITP